MMMMINVSGRRQRKPDVRVNVVGKTAEQTDDWQLNEDDVSRQSQRLTGLQSPTAA